jgi:hypothetical protein
MYSDITIFSDEDDLDVTKANAQYNADSVKSHYDACLVDVAD